MAADTADRRSLQSDTEKSNSNRTNSKNWKQQRKKSEDNLEGFQ